MPLEKTIVAAIAKEAAALGWMAIKIHGGPFQNKGIPDLLCLRGGLAVWLEVKQPGKKPTPIQVAMMNRLESEAGTPCAVVTSRAEAGDFLRRACCGSAEKTVAHLRNRPRPAESAKARDDR